MNKMYTAQALRLYMHGYASSLRRASFSTIIIFLALPATKSAQR